MLGFAPEVSGEVAVQRGEQGACRAGHGRRDARRRCHAALGHAWFLSGLEIAFSEIQRQGSAGAKRCELRMVVESDFGDGLVASARWWPTAITITIMAEVGITSIRAADQITGASHAVTTAGVMLPVSAVATGEARGRPVTRGRLPVRGAPTDACYVYSCLSVKLLSSHITTVPPPLGYQG
jgi:hypothetical protein